MHAISINLCTSQTPVLRIFHPAIPQGDLRKVTGLLLFIRYLFAHLQAKLASDFLRSSSMILTIWSEAKPASTIGIRLTYSCAKFPLTQGSSGDLKTIHEAVPAEDRCC
jgi:hypothetical protein